jgi:hypothetical protein
VVSKVCHSLLPLVTLGCLPVILVQPYEAQSASAKGSSETIFLSLMTRDIEAYLIVIH